MPIGLIDRLEFLFANGRGIRGNQIQVDRTLSSDPDSNDLQISDSFKEQQREGFSSRYHTGDYRYDRAFFSDEFYSDDEEELVGVETWNGIIHVITAEGRVGRLALNGGPFQMPGLTTGETVIDIARQGNFAFVGTSSNLRVYSVVDHEAAPFTLQHTYAISDTILAVCAPNDHSDRMYVVTVSATNAVFTHYQVNDANGSLSAGHSTTLSVADLNAALSIGEQSLVNITQIKAVSVFDINLWVYTQRSRDIKIIQVLDDADDTVFRTGTPLPMVSGGSGSGLIITSVTLNTNGAITAVNWDSGGTGFVAGDVLTFTQGTVSQTYTLLSAEVIGGVVQDLTGKEIGGGAFTVSTDGDHEAGRLQDIVSATRNVDEEIVASSYVVNLFTKAMDFRYGNYTDPDTIEGSLFSRTDPLAVKAPWAGVNPADLTDVLVAANVGRPVFQNGRVWYVDAHAQSPHDAVITFADPVTADFPSGHRWRGSYGGSDYLSIPTIQQNDVVYSIDLGRLLRYQSGIWRTYDFARYLGPGPAQNESHARVRVVASTLPDADKVGLLVSWDGHELQRVSAYTAPSAATVSYELHPGSVDLGDIQREIEAEVDGRLWLAVNPSQAELDALLVADNVGEPVLLHGQVYTVEHIHHDAIDATATFEDPPANVFGSLYRFRGSITGNTNYPSGHQNNDVVFRIDRRRLERYNGTIQAWVTWDDSLYTGPALDEQNALARIANSPITDKTTIVTSWLGSGGLRKVATFTPGTDETDVLDLVESGTDADEVRHLIEQETIIVHPDSTTGDLRSPTVADYDTTHAQSLVIGFNGRDAYKVGRQLLAGHAASATWTHIPENTELTVSSITYRWRESHWQDWLVSNPADNDYYYNLNLHRFRLRTDGVWADMPIDSALYRTLNFIGRFDTEADALAHVTANGQRALYPNDQGFVRYYIAGSVTAGSASDYRYLWVPLIPEPDPQSVQSNLAETDQLRPTYVQNRNLILPLQISQDLAGHRDKDNQRLYTNNDRSQVRRVLPTTQTTLVMTAGEEVGGTYTGWRDDTFGDVLSFENNLRHQGLVAFEWSDIANLFRIIIREDEDGPLRGETDSWRFRFRVQGQSAWTTRTMDFANSTLVGNQREWNHAVTITPWSVNDTVEFQLFTGADALIAWNVNETRQVIDEVNVAAHVNPLIAAMTGGMRIQHEVVHVDQNTLWEDTGIILHSGAILIITATEHDQRNFAMFTADLARHNTANTSSHAASKGSGTSHDMPNIAHVNYGRTSSNELLLSLDSDISSQHLHITALGG